MWEQEEVNEVQAKRDETLSRAGVRFTPTYWKRMYDLRDDDLEQTPPPDEGQDGAPAFAEGCCPGCAAIILPTPET